MLPNHLKSARRVLKEEAEALGQLAESLGEPFVKLVEIILAHTGPHAPQGQVVVSGLGKSGQVARKIASTLTSTGTPAVFLHPVEALHGDMGLVSRGDVCLALSRGASDELIRFAENVRRLGGMVAAITMKRQGNRLAEMADLVIWLPEVKEACPLDLAPTTSSTMMLALGDALAAALLEARGFGKADFARFHPEGTLGKRLLLRVSDLMHAGEKVPMVSIQATFSQMVHEMSDKALGMVCVVDEEGKLVGVLTDGDLRRLIERCDNLRELSITEALDRSPRVPGQRKPPLTIEPNMMAVACREMMQQDVITSLVVVDEANQPVGVIRLHDLLHAGLG